LSISSFQLGNYSNGGCMHTSGRGGTRLKGQGRSFSSIHLKPHHSITNMPQKKVLHNHQLTRSCSSKQYPNHIPTTLLQKMVLTAGSAAAALSDPWRADMVAVNGEVTGLPALKYMHGQMMESEEGRRILEEKPRIKSDILPGLLDLPVNTLGHTYSSFMKRNKITPDSRTEVMFVDDAELAYVMTRYRETHDLTHCILGQETNMVGEVLVKWVEALQFRLPMCAGGAIFGPLRFKSNQRDLYQKLLPWALQQGSEAKFLLNIYYEERWEQDIQEFRREFNITLPPKL